ncbi:MAG TPA: zinc transporter ZupT [Campylobacterales bacterium]|nr:zinc transporter ZupT [Campylobacterales bacterium]
MFSNVELLWAFALTLMAGLSAGIGALIILTIKNPSKVFLSIGLGFSAGVMLYVSFMEILPSAIVELAKDATPKGAEMMGVFAFFIGIGISALIDKLVPNEINPHELHDDKAIDAKNAAFLKKTGIFTAVAIAIHNFPEGFATFLFALSEPNAGIVVAAAIAIHNIPEGIAVALPIYMATKSRSKAFWLSFASGFAEPLGAFLGFLVLSVVLVTGGFIGIAMAAVAGIMVYVCLDELLPASRVYGNEHLAILGVTAGMAVMAVSLIMLS